MIFYDPDYRNSRVVHSHLARGAVIVSSLDLVDSID